MPFIVNDYGSNPPYGPQFQFDDSYFADNESAAAFMQAFQDAVATHSLATEPDYRMVRTSSIDTQIYPIPAP